MVSVSITGMGAISCLGSGPEALLQAALEERTGLCEGVGRVPPGLTPSGSGSGSRALAMTYQAISQAMAQAGWTALGQDDGLILATTTGEIPLWEGELIRFLRRELDAHAFASSLAHQPLGRFLEAVCGQIGMTGPRTLLTTACSASTQAVGLASLWLRSGRVRRCLVGGTEVLCDLTLEGFRSLQLLSSECARPFDRARAGINLSEGAAFLCLERDASPERTVAFVSGTGFGTDGFHMTSPEPEGQGLFRAMHAALEGAGLAPGQIDWVHAHGTGSHHNDEAEGRAIIRLFGGAGQSPGADPRVAPGEGATPWVSSTKWLHGHALGASGALELILCAQAMREGLILRTFGLHDPDPAITIRHPPRTLRTPVRHLLKSTLGFGGVNAAIVLSRTGAHV